MATMAIDVVDLNWRLLQHCGEKLRTLRGSRLTDRCNPRRARGDRCKRRVKNGEGPRIIALERASRRRDEIGQQLDEMVADDEPLDTFEEVEVFDLESYNARQARKQLKKATRTYNRRIRLADLRELDPDAQERAILLNLENQLRRDRERIPDIHARRRFLKDFIEFLEAQIANGAGEPTRALLIEHRIELCELETLLIAA